MFNECSRLSDIKTLENWNVSNNSDFVGMFISCNNLLDLSPLENWRVSIEKLKDLKKANN